MSDFYPSIHSDRELTHRHHLSMKLSEEKQRLEKEKQFERMVIIQKKIKKYS